MLEEPLFYCCGILCGDLLPPVLFSRGWIYEWSTPTVSVTMAMVATITMTSHQMMWITMVTTQLLSNWFALTDLRRLMLLAETKIQMKRTFAHA